ncbi:MAG: serine hydrolase domain-containing protein [Myxococcota bacterium]|nr:serine hydrolase domain-containing protein [Myxococcota bacterium]
MKWAVVHRKLARVDRALDKAIEGAQIPGAVILAQMPKAGEVMEFQTVRGMAVVQPERIPMARETVFDLASLTKPIATTTSVLLLVAEGRLELDAPVAKVLPAFAERDKEEVTLRQLLTHSSGLRPWRGFHETLLKKERKTGERLIGTAEGRDWILDRVIRSALVHEPGAAAVYGDLDFIVLGAVVEAVSGQSLDVFCQQRILDPLGLGDTRFHSQLRVEGDDAPVAIPHDRLRQIAASESCPWRDRILWGEVHDPNAAAMGGVAGHAGLFSTADDVMKFAKVWLDVWHGRSDLLPQEAVREFSKRQDAPVGSDWALGWDTPTVGQSSSGTHFSETSIGHLGFTGTSIWIDLEKEAIVVMLTNRVHLIAKKSRFELRPIVHDFVMDAFASG